jgi:hypothetical protein
MKSHLTSGCNTLRERGVEMMVVMASFDRKRVCVWWAPFGEFDVQQKIRAEFILGGLCRPVVGPDGVQVTKVASGRAISAVDGQGWSEYRGSKGAATHFGRDCLDCCMWKATCDSLTNVHSIGKGIYKSMTNILLQYSESQLEGSFYGM